MPNNNALRYYKRITQLAKQLLKPEGKIYFEINEQYARPVKEILEQNNFIQVQARQDLFGKDRFVSGTYPGKRYKRKPRNSWFFKFLD